MLYRIDVLESDDATTKTASSSFALHPNVPTILGRDATLAHIPIEHASVSRKHAIVTIVVAVSEANEKTGTSSSSSGGETYLEVTDCGSKLGTRVKGVVVEEGKEKDEDEEKEIKLDKFETKRVHLKTRGKVFVKFGKISASVRCVEEDGGGLDEDEANENVEEKGNATESEDEDEDEREEEEEENDDDDDVGVGWKRVQTKMEKKKTGGNKGQANVDRDEVEVETVIDASLFREQMISSPRLVSAIEEGENDENRRQVDINANRDDNNNNNNKRFRKQPITINGKLTVDGVDNAGSFSPSKRLNKKKQKVPWPYETDGYETLAQFETALDREEKAAQRLKEKLAEDLFKDPSTNGASFKKRKGATASAKGGGRGIRKRS